MPANIDILKPQEHLIDLSSHSEGDIGLSDDFELSFIFDDILLVEYIDESEDGDIQRNGIFVPTNAITRAWRKAKVILAGPKAKYAQEDDIVIFPHNLGVTISNMDIAGKGKVKKGVFLNEDRIFGLCKLKNDSTKSDS